MKRVSRSIRINRDEYLLFRNPDFIAINKPLGFEATAGKTPSSELRALITEMELANSDDCPVPVHSSSSSTSGVLLLSMHAAAGKLARAMVKEGQFWKCKYWGLLDGRIAGRQSSGVINIPMSAGQVTSDGEPSITHWRLLKYTDQGVSLVEFEPRTNIQNQIQLHAELVLKAPLLSDTGLHLRQVSASLPTGESTEVVAPVRDRFRDAMVSLGWT